MVNELKKMKIAALILTYNEEKNIKECINSLKFTDNIYVVDSFSTDKTITISEKLGVTVLQRRFDTYADQRNFAFKKIPNDYEWILMFDADERITSDLEIEILNELKDCNEEITSFRLRRKDIFNGKWLKRSTEHLTIFIEEVLSEVKISINNLNAIALSMGR